MHPDVKRIIHETTHKGHTIKIVERDMFSRRPRLFLYLYILDSKNNETYIGQHIEEEELKNVEIVIPKIHKLIDANIEYRIKWEEEKLEKKNKMNWTGRTFKRGDFVHYKGSEKYKPQDTYVWTHFGHCGMEYYVIEHDEGGGIENFINKRPFRKFGIGADGFEAIHSSQLDEKLKYIKIYCNEFEGETDELILIKEAD